MALRERFEDRVYDAQYEEAKAHAEMDFWEREDDAVLERITRAMNTVMEMEFRDLGIEVVESVDRRKRA